LATELSLDTTSGANGGALGCESPDTYVETFAEATRVATVGEVYEEIVESEYGFHVIMVTDRIVPTDEELVDIIKENAVLTMLEDWFLGAVADADVTVGEEYGTWQPNPPTVVPPSS
ncbi:MAG: peptidylprolyl isomerase, partial [Acidimicrobiia bacterium]